MTTQVFVVEDHDIMREMIIEFISRFPELEICGSTDSAEDALKHLPDAGANLVLVDTSLPGMSGIDLIAELRERHPDLRCIMLSGHSQLTYVRRALEAGADGYILKGDPYEFETAIQKIIDGERYISESLRSGDMLGG